MTDVIEDLDVTDRCANCGALIADGERVFQIDDDDVLCFACALKRGGEWSELERGWAKAPLVDDLLERDRPTQIR